MINIQLKLKKDEKPTCHRYKWCSFSKDGSISVGIIIHIPNTFCCFDHFVVSRYFDSNCSQISYILWKVSQKPALTTNNCKRVRMGTSKRMCKNVNEIYENKSMYIYQFIIVIPMTKKTKCYTQKMTLRCFNQILRILYFLICEKNIITASYAEWAKSVNY